MEGVLFPTTEATLEAHITHRHVEVRLEWRCIQGLGGNIPGHFGLYHIQTCDFNQS